MDEVYLLWFLSISMLVCSFLSGLVPLAFRLTDNKSRLLALLGSGILVGTALSIIIPEGVDSLYGPQASDRAGLAPVLNVQQDTEQIKSNHEANAKLKMNSVSDKPPDTIADQILSEGQNKTMTWLVGVSLIVGFVLMLLIEQFSIYQGAGDHLHEAEIIQTNSIRADYTLASQEDDVDIGLEEEDDKPIVDGNHSDIKPVRETHNIMIRAAAGDGPGSQGLHVDPNLYYDHSRHITSHRGKLTKVTPTLGLVIHAAADGIALGAAATTSHRDVEMIIFLAIMLHKAPAAFSLVVLLLHNGLRPVSIRRHLLAFSLSAPIAAIVTYYGLSQSGKEALRRNNATGIAMLFSAGTFLFVATVHVLPELVQNKQLTPKELFFLVGGAFLPLLLTQMI